MMMNGSRTDPLNMKKERVNGNRKKKKKFIPTLPNLAVS